MSDSPVPEARPDELSFVLSWRARGGALEGHLEAKNMCGHRVRLSGKPALTPLSTEGQPLDTQTAVTMEMRIPGYVELAPGERARASVSWAGWAQPAASGTVIITWAGGQAEVVAAGPRQPASRGPVTNLSASWFARLD